MAPAMEFPMGTESYTMSPKQLQEELRRLRPLAELGRLAATVAHEVRNPLAGISANAELLRESLSDPEDVESLDIILAEVDRLGSLVTDLLHYSRERRAECAPLDLVPLAKRCTDLLRADAEQSLIELVFEGNGLAWGDSELSQQSLLNVVKNAVQACSNGGTVRLCIADGRIDVCDQGTGVPEALRDTVFDPFVTGRTRGLGLGAAVARRCMQRQGGELELLNSSCNGSTFRLTWPQNRRITG